LTTAGVKYKNIKKIWQRMIHLKLLIDIDEGLDLLIIKFNNLKDLCSKVTHSH